MKTMLLIFLALEAFSVGLFHELNFPIDKLKKTDRMGPVETFIPDNDKRDTLDSDGGEIDGRHNLDNAGKINKINFPVSILNETNNSGRNKLVRVRKYYQDNFGTYMFKLFGIYNVQKSSKKCNQRESLEDKKMKLIIRLKWMAEC